MLYSEIKTHKEGTNQRSDLIIHFITIDGKPFIIFYELSLGLATALGILALLQLCYGES